MKFVGGNWMKNMKIYLKIDPSIYIGASNSALFCRRVADREVFGMALIVGRCWAHMQRNNEESDSDAIILIKAFISEVNDKLKQAELPTFGFSVSAVDEDANMISVSIHKIKLPYMADPEYIGAWEQYPQFLESLQIEVKTALFDILSQ